MIPVFYRGHLFLCPLRTMIVIVEYIVFYVFFKFFECIAWLEIQFILHMTKEGFSRSIIYAISSSRHRLDTTKILYLIPKARMRIMESLIRVNISSFELISEYCIIFGSFFKLFESLLYSFKSKVWWEFPGKSLSADHIFHEREICPSMTQPQIRNICSEFLVRYTCIEFSIHEIRCYSVFLSSFLYLFIWILSSYFGEEIIFLHQTKHFLMIHWRSWTREIHSNPSVPMFSFIFFYYLSYYFKIIFFSFFYCSLFYYSFFECIVSRKWHPSNVTEHLDLMPCGKFVNSFPLDAKRYLRIYLSI